MKLNGGYLVGVLVILLVIGGMVAGSSHSLEYKYFFTDEMSCKTTTTAEYVPLYDGRYSDSEIISGHARPVGTIVFTFQDLPNKCGDFPEGKKLRLLNNTIMIDNAHSCSYTVNYFLDTSGSHFSKGSVFDTNVVSKKGKFMEVSRVSVQTKENNIRVLRFGN